MDESAQAAKQEKTRAILRHLIYAPPQPIGFYRYSAFVAALRDARRATGRNMDTGQKESTDLHGSWLGAIGYLALLDQIGSCFQPKGMKIDESRAVVRALECFSDLSREQRMAIYALRCSFAHDYNLFNIPKGNKDRELLQHRFEVGVGGPLIRLPDQCWDGDWQNLVSETVTQVSLEALADLVEEIAQRLLQLACDDELEILLEGGYKELEAKYSICTWHGPVPSI